MAKNKINLLNDINEVLYFVHSIFFCFEALVAKDLETNYFFLILLILFILSRGPKIKYT